MILAVGCSKESDSYIKDGDPPFLGSMEAKINGELKTWGIVLPLEVCGDGFWGDVDCICCRGIQTGMDNIIIPEITEEISIYWDLSEEFAEKLTCSDVEASYDIRAGDSLTYYSTRDLCDPAGWICHDISFSITFVGNDVYKGTFSFVASSNCGEEEVVITDGKFEFKTELPLCDRN